MPLKQIGDGVDWEDMLKPSEEGECVICDEKTFRKRINQITGEEEFVHTPHDPGYLACWEVWRYLQEKPFRSERGAVEYQAEYGDTAEMESACIELQVAEHDPDYLLDERDEWFGV